MLDVSSRRRIFIFDSIIIVFAVLTIYLNESKGQGIQIELCCKPTTRLTVMHLQGLPLSPTTSGSMTALLKVNGCVIDREYPPVGSRSIAIKKHLIRSMDVQIVRIPVRVRIVVTEIVGAVLVGS